MKIGIMPPLSTPIASPAYLSVIGPALETHGFASVWAPEHVLLFDEYESKYPYTVDGRMGAGPTSGIHDPFAVLTYLAAVTKTIRLGTGICIVPQRNPVYTAKAVASLDQVSEGRFDFGVGIGWLAEEFAALGAPWPNRARRTREYLKVMQTLWSDDVSEYHSDMYDLPPTRQNPKPWQRPHPPIIFGGESEPALKRVADIGQGWFGFGLEPDTAATHIVHLTRMLEANGRKRSDIQVSCAPKFGIPHTRELIEGFAEAGADQVILVVGARDSDHLIARLDQLARDVVEPAAKM